MEANNTISTNVPNTCPLCQVPFTLDVGPNLSAIISLVESKGKLQSEVSSCETQIKELKSFYMEELEQYKSWIKELQETIETMKSEGKTENTSGQEKEMPGVDVQEENNNPINTSNAKLKEKLHKMKKENKKFQMKNQKLLKLIDDKDNQMESTISNLNTRLEISKKKNISRTADINKLQKEVDMLLIDNKEKVDALDQYYRQNDDLEQKINSLELDILEMNGVDLSSDVEEEELSCTSTSATTRSPSLPKGSKLKLTKKKTSKGKVLDSNKSFVVTPQQPQQKDICDMFAAGDRKLINSNKRRQSVELFPNKKVSKKG